MPFIPLEVYANNPSTTVPSGGTTAPAGGTPETWTVASSASFPAVEINATQFHVADPALPSEIITVTNISGTTWTVTRGAESTTPVAHTAGFTVVQVITAGTLAQLQYAPWQFPVKQYGAQGDGKIGTGGTGTSGTATFTDAGASFVTGAAPAGDVGKCIVINQGTANSGTVMGTSQNPFCGTITAVNSATSVTLSGNLAAPCASAPYIYGTDDTAAINAAVAAAAAWAVPIGNYSAEVIFEPCIYMLGSLTQQTSPVHYNTHIPIPYTAQNGRRLSLSLIGVPGIPYPDYWLAEVPQLSGACLVSAVFPPTQPDATFGQMSIIGSTSQQDFGGTAFANTQLNVDNLTLVEPWNSQIYGIDGRYVDQMQVPHGLARTFTPVNVPQAVIGGPYGQLIPTNTTGVAYAFPVVNNNAVSNAEWLASLGFPNGVSCNEHTSITKLTSLYGNAGLYVTNPQGAGKHGITIQQFCCEGCNYCIDATAGAVASNIAVNIALMDSEAINTAHVNDPNNVLAGTICWSEETSGHPVIISGTSLVVLNQNRNFPGPWSGAPAVPASGTASTNTQQNLAYRPATIYLSATTITAVFTGVAATGLTTLTGQTQASGGQGLSIRVPPGHYWAATYTGTLTAVWVLE